MARKKTVAPREVAVHIGNVEVDTGMVLIVDPVRARERENHIDSATGLRHGPGRVDYDKAMDFAYSLAQAEPHLHRQLTKDEHRQIGYGVVSSTGIGDGTFPVYAIVRGREVLRLEIDFQR
jgi:hypothetical protein